MYKNNSIVNNYYKILFFIISIFSITVAYADNVFIDNTNHSIEQIIENKNSLFEESHKNAYGINNNIYWIKINLKNTSSNIVNKYILFDFSLLKNLTAYNEQNGNILIKKNGYDIPIEKKEIKTNDIAFKYTLNINEEKTVYIKIKNDLTNIISYKIYEENNFFEVIKTRAIIETSILAALIILFVYNLFLAISLKSQIYILYLGYLLGSIVFFSNLTNYLQYITILNDYRAGLQSISIGLIVFSSLLFLNKFKLEKYPDFINLFFKITIVISLLLILAGILNVNLLLNAPRIIKILIIVFIFITIFSIIIYYLVKKYKEALYLALGWLFFLVGCICQALLTAGALDSSIFRYGIGIGTGIEALFYSLVLAKNYKFALLKVIKWKDRYLHELEIQNKEKNKLLDENIIYSETDLKGVITEVSEAFCRISGYSKEELIGKAHNIIRHPDTDSKVFVYLWETLQEDKIWTGEIKNRKKDSDYYWVFASISPIFKEGKKIGYSAVRQNISDKKKLEELSITDDLTQIYNRRYFNNVFMKFIDIAKRNNELINFAILDIDYFKQYNDTYGHLMGDETLKKVAFVMKDSLKRGNDYCFRLGGEEFGILYVTNSKENSVSFCNLIRENIESLKIEHKENSVSKYITASFGLYVKEAKEIKNIDEVYKAADILLYKAKETGRNKVLYNE